MKYPFKLHENVRWVARDVNGNITDERISHNLVVNNGLQRVAELLGGASTSALTHIAVGTGSTSATVTDTALETETNRGSATVTYPSNNEVQFEVVINYAGGGTARETGLFDAGVAGTMFNRQVEPADINIASGGNLTITIVLTIT